MAVGEISAEEFLAGPGGAGLNLGVPPAEDDEISAEEFLAGPDGAGLDLDALPPEAPEAFVSTDPDPTTAPEIPTETAEISVEEFLAGPDGIGVAEKAEPDEEWRSQVTQAKTPREIVQWLDSLSPDERRIEGVDARALIMDWRRAGWLNELPDGDYEIDGAQLPKDYVHQAARDQVVDEFYNDYRGMRKVAMGTDNPAQAVQAIDDFLGKHRPDIANSLRNQNVAYLGWDKRGKAQWALDAMKSAEGMLNVVDATLGFIPRGVKTSVRNRATELRVAEGQIEISPSIRKSFERAIVRDHPKPESSMLSLAALQGDDAKTPATPPKEELEAAYPFLQWTIRAPVKGGGDPYQDTVIALDEAEAAEIITRRMADMGLEPKHFKTIKTDRARIDATAEDLGVPGRLDDTKRFITVDMDIATAAREGNQEAFQGQDITDIRRRLGFRDYWSMFPSYQGDEVSSSLLQDFGRLAVSGEKGDEAELFAREGAATVAAGAELPIQGARALMEQRALRSQLSLGGLAKEGWIDLPDLKGRADLVAMLAGNEEMEEEFLSSRPELRLQVERARDQLMGALDPEEQLPGQTQFLKALAESGLGSLLPGGLADDIEVFRPGMADPADFPVGEMLTQIGSDLADFKALGAMGGIARELMGSSPIPGLTSKGARQRERLFVARLKETQAQADELGLPEMTEQMRDQARRLADSDFVAHKEAARGEGRALTDIDYRRTPEGRLARDPDLLEPFDSGTVPRALIESSSDPIQLGDIFRLKVQRERLTPSADEALRGAVAGAGKKVAKDLRVLAESGESPGAKMLLDVAKVVGPAAGKAGKVVYGAAKAASFWAGMGWKLGDSVNLREAMGQVEQIVARRARNQEAIGDLAARTLKRAPAIEGGASAEDLRTVFNIIEAQRHVLLDTEVLKTAAELEAWLDVVRTLETEVLGGNWANVLGPNPDLKVKLLKDGAVSEMTIREAHEHLVVLRGRQQTRELIADKVGASVLPTGELTLETLANQKPELVGEYIKGFKEQMEPYYAALLRLDESPTINAARHRMVESLRESELAKARAVELEASLPTQRRIPIPKDADPGLRAAIKEQDSAVAKLEAKAAELRKRADDHELKAMGESETIRTDLRAELREAKRGFERSKRLEQSGKKLEAYLETAPKRFDTHRDFVEDGINARVRQIEKLKTREQSANVAWRAAEIKKDIKALKAARSGDLSSLRARTKVMRIEARDAVATANRDALAVDKKIIRAKERVDKERAAARELRKQANSKLGESRKGYRKLKKEYRDTIAVQNAERKAARAAIEAEIKVAKEEALLLKADSRGAQKDLKAIDKDIRVRASERAELEAYEEWNLPSILNEPVRGRRQMALDDFAADLAKAPVGVARPSRGAADQIERPTGAFATSDESFGLWMRRAFEGNKQAKDAFRNALEALEGGAPRTITFDEGQLGLAAKVGRLLEGEGVRPVPWAPRNAHAPFTLRVASDGKWYPVNELGYWGKRGSSTADEAAESARGVQRITRDGDEVRAPAAVRPDERLGEVAGLARASRDADLATALKGMPLVAEQTRARRWTFKVKLKGTKTPKTGRVTARTELQAKRLVKEKFARQSREIEGGIEVAPPKMTKLENEIITTERVLEAATDVGADLLKVSTEMAGKTPHQVIVHSWDRMDEAINFDLQLANATGGTISPKLGEIMRSMERMTEKQRFQVADLVKDRARAKTIAGKKRAGETEEQFRARVAKLRRRYTGLAEDEKRLLPLVKFYEGYFDDFLAKLRSNGLLRDWSLYDFLDKNDVSSYVYHTLSKAGVGQTRMAEAAFRRGSGSTALMKPGDSPILQARGIPGTIDEIDDLMRWHVAEQIVRHNGDIKPGTLVSQREVLDVYRRLPGDVHFFEGSIEVAAAQYGQHASKSIAMKILFDDLEAVAKARFPLAALANDASKGQRVIDPATGLPVPQGREALDRWAMDVGESAYGQPIVRISGPEYTSLLTGKKFPVGKDAIFDYMGVMVANGAKESEVIKMMQTRFGIDLTKDQARLITMGDVYLPQDVASFLKMWARPSMKQMLRGAGDVGSGTRAVGRGGALLLDMYDNMTAWFKGFVTVIWPRFHGRNHIGGHFQSKMVHGSNYTMKDQADALLLNMPIMESRVVRAGDGTEVIIPGTKHYRIDLGGPNRDPSLRSANLTLEEWRLVDRELGISTSATGAADLEEAANFYLSGAGLRHLQQLPANTRKETVQFLERIRDTARRTQAEGFKPVVWDELIVDLWKRWEAEAKGSKLAKGDLSGPGGKTVTGALSGAAVVGGAAFIGASTATPIIAPALLGGIVGALTARSSKQLFRLGAEMARMSENHLRWANFAAGVRSGLTFEEAAFQVNRALFNYSPAAQSWFSYQIMRRYHPFWTFRSKNFALYTHLMLNYPERMAVLEKVLAAFTHHDGAAELRAALPEYLSRRLTAYLGEGSWLAGVGLPVEDIVEALRPTGKVPLPGGAGIIQPSNPVITTAFEMLSGQSIYFERPITDIRSVRALEDLDGLPVPLQNFLREFVGYGESDGRMITGANRHSPDHPLRPKDAADGARRWHLLKRLDITQLLEMNHKFRASAYKDAIGELNTGGGKVGGLERTANILSGAKTYRFDPKELEERAHRNMMRFLLDGWRESDPGKFSGVQLKPTEDVQPAQGERLQEQALELLESAPLGGAITP